MLSSAPSVPATQKEKEEKSQSIEPHLEVSYDETFWYFNEEVALHQKLYDKGVISLKSSPIDTESMARVAAKVTDNTFKLGYEEFRIDSRDVLETEVKGAKEVIAAYDPVVKGFESMARFDELRWSILVSLLTNVYHQVEKNISDYYKAQLKENETASSDEEYQPQNAYLTVRSILTIVHHYLDDVTDQLSIIYRMSRSSPSATPNTTQAIPFIPFVFDTTTSEKLEELMGDYQKAVQAADAAHFDYIPSGTGFSDNTIALRISPSYFMREDNQAINQFLPFDRFCFKASLFGTNLVAVLTNGSKIPFLNFQIKIPAGQEIVDLECIGPIFFEELQYQTINTFALLMKRLGAVTAHAMCQLQYIEYAIFGFKLCYANKMKFSVLEKLFQMIEERQTVFFERVGALFDKLKMELLIFSPFDNLLGPIKKDKRGSKVMTIINLLCLESLTSGDARQNESSLIESCVLALLQNTIDPFHATIWNDFLTAIKEKCGSVITLEAFLRISNVVAYAIAAYGMSPFSLCFIQMCSDMGVQNWMDFYVNHSVQGYEPSVVINVFDSCFTPEETQGSKMKQAGSSFHLKDQGEKKSAYLLMAHQAFFQQSLRNAASLTPKSAVAALNISPENRQRRGLGPG